MNFEEEIENRLKYRLQRGHSLGSALKELGASDPVALGKFKLTVSGWRALAKRLTGEVKAGPRIDFTFPQVVCLAYMRHDGLPLPQAMAMAAKSFPDLHEKWLREFNAGTPGSTNSQPRNFEAAIAELKASGKTTAQAIMMAARDYPALHEAYVRRMNRSTA